jgi:hypothetical protein
VVAVAEEDERRDGAAGDQRDRDDQPGAPALVRRGVGVGVPVTVVVVVARPRPGHRHGQRHRRRHRLDRRRRFVPPRHTDRLAQIIRRRGLERRRDRRVGFVWIVRVRHGATSTRLRPRAFAM